MPKFTKSCGCRACTQIPRLSFRAGVFLISPVAGRVLANASQLEPFLNQRKTLCPRLCSLPGDSANLMTGSCRGQRLVHFAQFGISQKGHSSFRTPHGIFCGLSCSHTAVRLFFSVRSFYPHRSQVQLLPGFSIHLCSKTSVLQSASWETQPMTVGSGCAPKVGFCCWPWLAVIKTPLVLVRGTLIGPGRQFECYC